MKPEDFDAIIFDLGGVILNIDYDSTRRAFEQLGLDNFNDLYSQASQSGLFDRFETGQISASYFINNLLEFLPRGTTPNQVVHAWNAMILHFPTENLDFLAEIKNVKRTFLLSNTNEIHVQCFNRKLAEVSEHSNLNPFFEKVYFSNELGKRKPHPETFRHLCELHELNPAKTLFIDDSAQHLEGAKEIGLQTLFFQPGRLLQEVFVNL